MQMKKYKLGEIVEINSSSIKSSDKIDEILYLDTANITENIIGKLQRFDLEKAPSRAQRKVKNNTIIFSTVRPNQNHFGIMKNPAANLIVSSGFATLDIKNPDEFNADYLYYNLTQPYNSELFADCRPKSSFFLSVDKSKRFGEPEFKFSAFF